MRDLLRPWLSGGGGALENYLPKMYEIQFNSADDMESVQTQIGDNARFLTHASALHSSTSAGRKMIFISAFVLLLTLGAIGVCISYIARNTALLHKRELEILNQIGATDNFYLTDNGICWVYNPYEIACYATGQTFIEAPFTELEMYFLPDTPIRRLIQK